MTLKTIPLIVALCALAPSMPALAGLVLERPAPITTDLSGGVPNAAQILDALAPPASATRTKSFGGAKDLEVVERRVRLDIPFANNSADVTGTARQTLAELATALNSPRLATAQIRIEGHANRTGAADHNQRLTEQRAAAVSRLLYGGGVTAGRLSAAGFGFDRPIPGTNPVDGRNRRVEIVAAP